MTRLTGGDKGGEITELVEANPHAFGVGGANVSGASSLPSFSGSTLNLLPSHKFSLAEHNAQKKKVSQFNNNVDKLFQTINSIDQKLPKKGALSARNAELKVPFVLRQLKSSSLDDLAKALMAWVLILHSSIDLTDFLDYMTECKLETLSVPLQAAAAYETAIQDWVIAELHPTSDDEDEGNAQSIASFGMFAKLMIKSFKLGDLSTSFTIAETLTSPTILSRHKVFRDHPQFAAVRGILLHSAPFQICSPTCSPQELYNKYEQYTEELNTKCCGFVGQLSRLTFYLNAIGPICREQQEGVNIIRCAAAYDVIQKYWSNNLTCPKIKEILTTVDPNILTQLATRVGESKDMINRHRGRQNKFGLFLTKRKRWGVGTDVEKMKLNKKNKHRNRSTMMLPNV
eukprot:CAMPEP_0201515604 /NCGR_PEP_ID=MMETSP0161_2-20130828/7116_1 /ASSEMBLY_ACC=CAM_ASM_000251 /TAXON_ID=180227 /ORGANISM="Neoparamoeba aestuarina, Strain SoJaBio B1-5/56/2" /LENGTH=399 /DNA_ID=CAMNT_0047912471 /DNA_START=471 /DNA_END=1670 /DNA_ORIENTATION=+